MCLTGLGVFMHQSMLAHEPPSWLSVRSRAIERGRDGVTMRVGRGSENARGERLMLVGSGMQIGEQASE